MKKLFIISIISLIVGCTGVNKENNEPINHKVGDIGRVVTIDSCEYLLDYNKLAHKGNCKYCTERRKKEYTQVVDSLFMMQE